MKTLLPALIFLAFVLPGCSQQENGALPNGRFCSYEPQYRETLLKRVKESGISILPGHSEACFEVKASDSPKVAEIAHSLDKEGPPPGRSISAGSSGNAEIAAILEQNHVGFERRVYQGTEYIEWSYKDGKRVEGLIPLLPQQREFLKRMRLEVMAETRKN